MKLMGLITFPVGGSLSDRHRAGTTPGVGGVRWAQIRHTTVLRRRTFGEGLRRGHGRRYQGAKQIRERMPDAVLVFLLPPTITELEARLRGRDTETSEAIDRRLAAAYDELKEGVAYDYAIVNERVEDAAQQLSAIITAEQCKVARTDYYLSMQRILDKEGQDL